MRQLGQIITSAIGLCLGLACVGLIDNCFKLVQGLIIVVLLGQMAIFCGLMFIFWAVGWISLSDEDNLYGWY
jgi:hypothetical protein